MIQEQLKKLVEWYYEEKYSSVSIDWIMGDGEIDSNQLDMLEDKMMSKILADSNSKEGLVSERIVFTLSGYWYVEYTSGSFILNSEGKTKNEARLNAILKYVEELE